MATKTTNAAVLGSFINFATGLANMYTKPTMIEIENRAYLAMFAQNGMSSPAMAICEKASRSSCWPKSDVSDGNPTPKTSMFAASIASKAAAGFWSQNAQIAHAANAVIPTTLVLVFSFFLGLKLSLVLASDSSPRWTDDDDTIDLGFVLFFLLAKLLRSEKEEEHNELYEEHVDEKEENILISIDVCVCV